MMNKPHKFKYGATGTSSYAMIVYCEYCGHISFYANRDNNTEAQKIGQDPCPNSPENYKSEGAE